MPSHSTGIEAHVVIKLNEGIDIWQAFAALNGLQPGADPQNRYQGVFTMVHLHVALGEIDLLADVHCAWSTPTGWETHVIGQWVNKARQLRLGGQLVVASTSTSVCMNH